MTIKIIIIIGTMMIMMLISTIQPLVHQQKQIGIIGHSSFFVSAFFQTITTTAITTTRNWVATNANHIVHSPCTLSIPPFKYSYNHVNNNLNRRHLFLSSTARFLSSSSSSSSSSKKTKRPDRNPSTTTKINSSTTGSTTSGSSSTRIKIKQTKNQQEHKQTSQAIHSSSGKKQDDTTNTNTNVKTDVNVADTRIINLSTVTLIELEEFIVTILKYPKYRVNQIWDWIRKKGVTDPNQMNNIPNELRQSLIQYTKPSSLQLVYEIKSKDGTIKRAYQCNDGIDEQIIESVLMPYDDGRYTACISSQAGCAQGCVFCATGQMGFARQLSSNEIFEQVSLFASELQKQSLNNNKNARLSNVVFMGMGEPLANYKNVVAAVNRIVNELGIGARKITISTVGIVPNVRKLIHDTNMPPIRLAISLHSANDIERSALLPANERYGGLVSLMDVLREYVDITGRRITFEWALINNQNDTPEIARQLGKLITQGPSTDNTRYYNNNSQGKNKGLHYIRRDMVHINVIPLNPTSQYGGSPSQKKRVDTFIDILQNEFGIACTPRVRRGIDINAGCGQLKADVLRKKQLEQEQEQHEDADSNSSRTSELSLADFIPANSNEPVNIGVYADDDDEEEDFVPIGNQMDQKKNEILPNTNKNEYWNDNDIDDQMEEVISTDEVQRLISLVKGTTINTSVQYAPSDETNQETK